MEKRYQEHLKQAEEKAGQIIESLQEREPNLNGVGSETEESDLLKEYATHIEELANIGIDKKWLLFNIKRSRGKIAAWSSVAAAALLIISLFVFKPKSEEIDTLLQSSEIKPVSGVVTLKLSDGREVTLDSLKVDDNLISSNGVEVNVSANELSYQSSISTIYIDDTQVAYNELYIPKGRSFSLILSDGSKVWLNAESSIRYPVTFNNSERIIELRGEAFFDVKHDPSRQFIVKTNDYQVRVLGTKFNISSYPDEQFTATTLVSGSVSVGAEIDYTIKPGEQLKFNKSSKIAQISKVDVDIYTSWIDNKLIMDQLTLEEVFKILMRRYDIDVFYSREEAKYEKFTGKVPLNDNLNVILDQISTVSKIDFQIENKLIVIKFKE